MNSVAENPRVLETGVKDSTEIVYTYIFNMTYRQTKAF